MATTVYAVPVTIDVPQTHIDYVTARAEEEGITGVQYLLKIIRGDYIQYLVRTFKKNQANGLAELEADMAQADIAYEEYIVNQQAELLEYLVSLGDE